MVHEAVVVVALMADAQGPFDFVLDTGADTTIVDPAVAKRLKLAPLGEVLQSTLVGAQALNCVAMRTLAAGSAEVTNLVVLVEDLRELRNLDGQIAGIAGQDFLSHFNYVLDYRERSLRIERGNELRDSISGKRVAVEMRGKKMMVAAEVQGQDRAKLRLILDSGATSVVLLRVAAEAMHLGAYSNGQEITGGGRMGLPVGRVHALRVGPHQFHEVVVALSGAEAGEQIGDGLLPTALFQKLFVNNRERFVVFNPREPNK